MGRLAEIAEKIVSIEKANINNDIEKAWKSYPIGSVITRKDGKKYKKVSETGDSAKDWKLVTKDKIGNSEESGTKEHKHKPEELKKFAQNTSEESLQAAVKKSPDPNVREAAHQELDRRNKEEKPQEDNKSDQSNADSEKKSSEKATSGSKKEKTYEDYDNDIKSVEDLIKQKRSEDIDYSDMESVIRVSDEINKLIDTRKNLIEDQKSLRKVSTEEYRKDFKSFKDRKSAKDFYEAEMKNLKFSDSEWDSVYDYTGNLYEALRDYLTGEGFKSGKYKKELDNHIENITSFISKNKIKENLSLNRRVKGDAAINFFSSLGVGDVYEDKSFSSSSLLELNHFGDFNIEILAKKGSSVANVDNRTETEYLIDKGSKFRVISKTDEGIIVELL